MYHKILVPTGEFSGDIFRRRKRSAFAAHQTQSDTRSNLLQVLEGDVRTAVALGFRDDLFGTPMKVVSTPATEPIANALEGQVCAPRSSLLEAGTPFFELAAFTRATLSWANQKLGFW